MAFVDQLGRPGNRTLERCPSFNGASLPAQTTGASNQAEQTIRAVAPRAEDGEQLPRAKLSRDLWITPRIPILRAPVNDPRAPCGKTQSLFERVKPLILPAC